ncbi:MAG TPA: hypothetical protein VH044_19575 [Polyangiaceae bacterium]|nr:hypothetical protein [Polyangiaceae bacterium]
MASVPVLGRRTPPPLGRVGPTYGRSFGVEGGYGHTFFRVLTLRGLMGVGDYLTIDTGSVIDSGTTTTTSRSSNNAVYLQPGALIAVALGPVLLGADANVFYMPTTPISNDHAAFGAFIFGFQAGVRL